MFTFLNSMLWILLIWNGKPVECVDSLIFNVLYIHVMLIIAITSTPYYLYIYHFMFLLQKHPQIQFENWEASFVWLR